MQAAEVGRRAGLGHADGRERCRRGTGGEAPAVGSADTRERRAVDGCAAEHRGIDGHVIRGAEIELVVVQLDRRGVVVDRDRAEPDVAGEAGVLRHRAQAQRVDLQIGPGQHRLRVAGRGCAADVDAVDQRVVADAANRDLAARAQGGRGVEGQRQAGVDVYGGLARGGHQQAGHAAGVAGAGDRAAELAGPGLRQGIGFDQGDGAGLVDVGRRPRDSARGGANTQRCAVERRAAVLERAVRADGGDDAIAVARAIDGEDVGLRQDLRRFAHADAVAVGVGRIGLAAAVVVVEQMDLAVAHARRALGEVAEHVVAEAHAQLAGVAGEAVAGSDQDGLVVLVEDVVADGHVVRALGDVEQAVVALLELAVFGGQLVVGDGRVGQRVVVDPNVVRAGDGDGVEG